MLAGFTPAVWSWFADTLGAPTAPQREAWPLIKAGRDVVIAAPTGSGKTLAACLAAIDDLAADRARGALPDEVRVVYVSPLRALSNDVGKNLLVPLRGVAARLGLAEDAIRVAVRTGDTTPRDRRALHKRPPHVLVTTPESLFVLLGSASGQALLSSARTLILDEVHAVCGVRRGAHLALSVERLDALVQSRGGRPVQRVGLSATQRPIDLVARFVAGAARPPCHVVDAGHRRALDVDVCVPPSPLEAVMSNEVFAEVVRDVSVLVAAHRTTLIFVNTRRMAERLAARLDQALTHTDVGAGAVCAHHGSMSLSKRHDAETRLKAGALRALVATSSMELGIDVGEIDLVCQLGGTKTIAALVQRIGRARHQVTGTPKGRLFPLTRDELGEAAAALHAFDEGDLDTLVVPAGGIDVLTQHLIAHVAAAEDAEQGASEEPGAEPRGVAVADALTLVRRAAPFAHVDSSVIDKAIRLAALGVDTGKGRRGAWLYHDVVAGRLRPRRGARLAALTSGGVIPDMGDYVVVDQASDVVVGAVTEEFAVESSQGDVFQLGNTSWRVERVERGTLRVSDARGQPATVPFWFGEAPARSRELSAHVSIVRQAVSDLCDRGASEERVAAEVARRFKLPSAGARQLAAYFCACHAALGALPTTRRVIVERFEDSLGGTQLVLHAPFGARITRAWGLALRKRFCRTFDFELQAAATEDGILLSVGTIGGVDLAQLVRFVTSKNIEAVLVQAVLQAPMFGARFRHNATRALTVLRQRGGRRVPPGLIRLAAEDVLVSVFPEQIACPENLPGGDREVPDHPLVHQTIHDCLHEVMDVDGARDALADIEQGAIEVRVVERAEPSPLAMELVTARPYAFLDDVPFEERRVQAVLARRHATAALADETVAIDGDVIAAVVDEVAHAPASLDEAWDLLLQVGFLWPEECARWPGALLYCERLVAIGRAVCEGGVFLAAELRGQLATHEGLVSTLRGRCTVLAPTTRAAHRARTPAPAHEVDVALDRLVREGVLLSGRFRGDVKDDMLWARHLVVRARRRLIDRLRAAIEPVSPEALARFLVVHHHLLSSVEDGRFAGARAVAAALALLDGVTAPAAAWEQELVPARARGPVADGIDAACLSGAMLWRCRQLPTPRTDAADQRRARPAPPLARHTALTFASPDVARLVFPALDVEAARAVALSITATRVRDALIARGPSFARELIRATGLDAADVTDGLREAIGAGVVTADGFGAARVVVDEHRRAGALDVAGRFALAVGDGEVLDEDARLEGIALTLLRRLGVLFRRLVERDPLAPAWRDLLSALRRLEVRGAVRGGRFVSGFGGEQFALSDAGGVDVVRALRQHRQAQAGAIVVVAGADPLNLTGGVLPVPRVPAVVGARVALRDGRAVGAIMSAHGRAQVFDNDHADAIVAALRRTTVKLAS